MLLITLLTKNWAVQPKNKISQRMKKLTQLKILTQNRKSMTQEIQLTQHLMVPLPAIGLRDYKNNTILRPDT